MTVLLGGTRGTRPVCEASHARYGGDTTCVLVRGADGTQLVIDAGTGLRNVEPWLHGDPDVLLLLTHYHLDHLVGLPSCPALYGASGEFVIAAPLRESVRVAEAIPRFLSAPFWPVPISEMPALRFLSLPDEAPAAGLARGGLVIRWTAVHHRNGCHAYRIDEPSTGASMVFATDVEWPLSTAEEQARLLRLCTQPGPCGLLLMDGQWDEATYAAHRDWGHSRWQDVLAVARASGAAQTWVTHHAPDATDAALDNTERRVQDAWPTASLARQGRSVELEGGHE